MADAPLLGGGKGFELEAGVYDQPFNGPLVHEVVVAELAARRRARTRPRTARPCAAAAPSRSARRAPAAPARARAARRR